MHIFAPRNTFRIVKCELILELKTTIFWMSRHNKEKPKFCVFYKSILWKFLLKHTKDTMNSRIIILNHNRIGLKWSYLNRNSWTPHPECLDIFWNSERGSKNKSTLCLSAPVHTPVPQNCDGEPLQKLTWWAREVA